METKLEASVTQLSIPAQFAVGNDLVCLSTFSDSFTDVFKKKVYTPAEIIYCDSFSDSLQRYASTWAAKEAVYKAARQIDPSPLGFKNIEITRAKAAGMPIVNLPAHLNKYKVSLTISHDGDYVWALALINTIA